MEVVGRGPPEPRKANACEFPWQIARLKVLATDVTIRQGGRVEIHTESWVDEAGSHHTCMVVVHDDPNTLVLPRVRAGRRIRTSV